MPEEPNKSMIDLKDLAGLGKATEKLMETLQAAFGRVADGTGHLANRLWLDKKGADNEAYRIRTVGAAQTETVQQRAQMIASLTLKAQTMSLTGNDVNAELIGIPAEVREQHARMTSRLAYENALREINRDQVTGFASDALANEPTVSEEPVNPDFTTRLYNIAQDISDEEMQALWGNILAGEIRKPGSYSLRTLEVLKNITPYEAQLFKKATNFAIKSGKGYGIAKTANNPSEMVSDTYGFTYTNLQELIDCGLILASGSQIELELAEYVDKKTFMAAVVIGKHALVASSTEYSKFIYSVNIFTRAGVELYNLVKDEVSLSIPYLTEFAKKMRIPNVTVECGELAQIVEENSISIKQPLTEVPI